jgi:hypothetical protein
MFDKALLVGVMAFAVVATCTAGKMPSAAGETASHTNLCLTLKVGTPDMEAGHRSLDFFVNCVMSNTGDKSVEVRDGARVYLEDESGAVHRCLKFTSDYLVTDRTLEPGQQMSWWQHSRAHREGTFKARACWDHDEQVASEPVQITIKRAPDSSENRRVTRLQEHIAEFVELVPNTVGTNACLSKVSFTNEPIAINGMLYNGFSFVMPEGTGDLVWALVLPVEDRNYVKGWYIIPAQGRMKGFSNFDSRRLAHDDAAIGHANDQLIIQRLARSCFVANQRYVIWFSSTMRDIGPLALSLNVLEGGFPYSGFYSGLNRQLKGAATAPVRRNIAPRTSTRGGR